MTQIVLFSSVVTLFSTGAQVVADYQSELNGIDHQFDQIKTSYSRSFAQSLWSLNAEQTHSIIDGVLSNSNIRFIRVKQFADGDNFTGGIEQTENFRERKYPIIYEGETEPIGEFLVQATLDEVDQKILEKITAILFSQGIKTFLVSCFMLYLVNSLVIRHLNNLSEYVTSLELGNENQSDFTLDRKETKETRLDELAQLANGINHMRSNLNASYQIIKANEKELEMHRHDLEILVEERTRTIRKLQAQLVASAHKSGMAEIASDVLHKIGNILNSVGVNIAHASDCSRKLPVDKLNKVLELLTSHSKDIGEFINSDPKGKMLIPYLEGLVERTTNLVEEINNDFSKLKSDLIRAQEVVHEQSKYSHAPEYTQAINLLEVLEHACDSIKHDDLKININTNELPPININQHKLTRILVSLLEEVYFSMAAIKETEKIVDIQVSLEAPDESINISIHNPGRGFSAAELEKIFDMKHPFSAQRVNNPLHDCANAARQIDAELIVESSGIDKGAIYSLKLPNSVLLDKAS